MTARANVNLSRVGEIAFKEVEKIVFNVYVLYFRTRNYSL